MEGLARECHDRAQFFKGGVRAQTEQRPLAARGGLLAHGIGCGAGAAQSHHAVPGLGDQTAQGRPGDAQAINEIGRRYHPARRQAVEQHLELHGTRTGHGLDVETN